MKQFIGIGYPETMLAVLRVVLKTVLGTSAGRASVGNGPPSKQLQVDSNFPEAIAACQRQRTFKSGYISCKNGHKPTNDASESRHFSPLGTTKAGFCGEARNY